MVLIMFLSPIFLSLNVLLIILPETQACLLIEWSKINKFECQSEEKKKLSESRSRIPKNKNCCSNLVAQNDKKVFLKDTK